ncbi:MAG: TetR/AcrR family transcriptional regulator [Homoserinimonas sp.]|nr:TetR/AcrR family transcriptional regulator [Homoserinimonas sp.]
MPHHNLEEALPGTTATLRNEPVQARSTARLSRLLDAAAEVIDEIGFERLTTAMVAERAGASIGTVYRYFPDRIAVLQSLSMRTATDFAERVSSALQDEKLVTWLDAVDASIDLVVEAFVSTPGFRSLRFGDVIDVRPAESDRTNNSIIASAIADVLSARFDLKKDDDLEFRLEVAVGLVDGLLARAFAIEHSGDKRFIAEARSVARGYLVGYYGEPSA